MSGDEARVVAAQWLRKARGDLRAVEILLEAGDCPSEVVCFHAQQVAEKSLKALLARHRISFPRTHDLTELLNLVPRHSSVPRAAGDLAELTQWAVAPRYPDDWGEFTREMAERAHQTAKAVFDAVMAELSDISSG